MDAFFLDKRRDFSICESGLFLPRYRSDHSICCADAAITTIAHRLPHFESLILRFFSLGAGLVSDVGGAIERAFHVIILRGLAARSGGQLRLRRWLYPDRLRLGHARLDWSRRCFLLFLAPEDNAQSDEDQKD